MADHSNFLKPEHFEMETFGQILELDDGESRDIDSFSGSIVASFFGQAETTFVQIEEGLKARDLDALCRLGHFLKGSSATLGLHRIRDACERIQNLGAGRDEKGLKELNDKEYALNTIEANLVTMKRDYEAAAQILRQFYRIA